VASATRLFETGESQGKDSSVGNTDNWWRDVGRDSRPSRCSGEMQFPRGSDWSSIPEAGSNAARRRTRRRVAASGLVWSARAKVRVNRRQHEQAHASSGGLDQTGQGSGPASSPVTGLHPHETRRTGPTYPNAKRAIGTREPLDWLSSAVDPTSRRPGRMPPAGGLPEQQRPGVMPGIG
jgi:hypothetical protein